MLCKMIVEVPAALHIEDEAWQAENQAVCYEISRLGTVWPGLTLSSTKTITGRKIMLCSLTVPGDNKLLLVQGLLAIYGLDWQVLALQEFGCAGESPEVFLPVQPRGLEFMDDRYGQVTNEAGDVDTVKLQPEASWVPVFDGQSSWV